MVLKETQTFEMRGMHMIQAVLFDLGGTIHTNEDSAQRQLQYAQRLIDRLNDYQIHIDTPIDLFSRRLRENTEIYKRESEQTLRELPAEIIWNDYYLKDYNIGVERLKPIAEELSFRYDYDRVKIMRREHLNETLQALQNMGVRLGVISNIISKTVVGHFLREYDIYDRMECVITSAETSIRKPSPEIFRIAERKMNLLPEQFAYVGDTLSRDVAGVRAAGWKMAIRIENPSIAHRDVKARESGLEADYVIHDLSEIIQIIQNERNSEA